MSELAQEVLVKDRAKRGTYTAEYVINRAKSEGWAKSSDWRLASLSSYMAASRNGWLQEVYVALGWPVRKSRKTDTNVTPSEVQG